MASWQDRLRTLTSQEVKALQLAADGNGARDVAIALGIHEGTAKRYWNQAEEKLGADSIAHAVAMALRRGLIQ